MTAAPGGESESRRREESVMKKLVALVLVCAAFAFGVSAQEVKPIKALLITGGPYHDYTAQKKALTEGVARRANVEWTIFHEGDKAGTRHKLSIYEKEDWAKGF